MAIYPVFATTDDLADYLGVNVIDLPSDSSRLLIRASENIFQLIKRSYDDTDDDNVEAVKLATCSQVEFWFTMGEEISISIAFEQMKLGSFSFKNAIPKDGAGNVTMSQRAIGYLEEQSLLFRGVSFR